MTKITMLFAFLITGLCASAQLDKGTWLVGGNGNFSAANGETISNGGIQKSTYLNISLSPDIGYFIEDKFAIGLKPSLTYLKADYGQLVDEGIPVAGGGYSHIMWFDIGPFLRYYFLPIENRINFFAEGNYSHGIANTNPGKGKRYSYSIDAGPVAYFNTSVGIEVTVGYHISKSTTYGLNSSNDDYTSKKSSFQIGIGLQVHLEK